MLMMAFVALLVGAALGVRFRVLILLPAIVLAVVGILAGAIAHRSAVTDVVATVFAVVASLQIGYLFGGVGIRTILRHDVSYSPRQNFPKIQV
jgi:hypothetical protein